MCVRRVDILSRFDIALSLLQSLTHSHTVLRHLCFLPTIIYMHLSEFTISFSSPVISTGQHIDVGDEDYHDGDDDVDYTDDVDDVDDSHGSPSQLLQGGYQRNQHYGGGNYHSGYYRPNKQHGNGYGGQYPKKYGSGYKH
ncbi:Immunogenic miracidial antigen 8I [Schistosoma japonicum]|uniref:Immunogenic miracidial antigen 8I n=1 Tax=Schistosoma japonicum TaxID=6182 RepID=A0A4Z2DQN2_SCHJA|nr:Immunogenic miracidial antigen 8I [Schistosoma japonicum]